VDSSYLGGSGADTGWAVSIDADENVYLGGRTTSSNFPTSVDAYKTAPPYSGGAGFVTTVSADGLTLTYATFLGGTPVPGDRPMLAGEAA
jgi:hypothetical protein